jgi:hypothetical protein
MNYKHVFNVMSSSDILPEFHKAILWINDSLAKGGITEKIGVNFKIGEFHLKGDRILTEEEKNTVIGIWNKIYADNKPFGDDITLKIEFSEVLTEG